MRLQAVVEGDTDIPVVTKLAQACGFDDVGFIDSGGKSALDARLAGYNGAAKGHPWFVLRDLDQDAPCAPAFVRQRGFTPSKWMVFRIAVTEVESWLMADRKGLAKFLHVPEQWLPDEPDRESDPTRVIVDVARRSRRARVREQLVPAPGRSTAVGPGYEAAMIEFAALHWRLAAASRSSDSLRRAFAALLDLRRRWSLEMGA